MKRKLIPALGLLALTPLAAQAELVAMQDSELAEVSGQQALAGITFNFNATFDRTVAGLGIYKNVYGYKWAPADWELGQDIEVSNPVSGRYLSRMAYIGNDGGDKYAYRYVTWGRPSMTGG